MPYIKKTCYLPYRIEVEQTHSSRYGVKGVQYAPRANPTPEEVRENNARHRVKKLYWIIATNFDFGDYHTVLTYRRDGRPTPQAAREIVKRFLRQIRKEYRRQGGELKYIITTEYAKSAIHHHLIINEIGQTAKIVRRLWQQGGVHFTPIYENGEVEDLAAYLIKETQNSFRDPENPSKLSYSCSRNLKRPKVKTEIVKAGNWMELPVAPKGYCIKKDSIVSGISKITGYPYQRYTLYKCNEQMKGKDGWIRPREHDSKRKQRYKYNTGGVPPD